MIALAGTMFGVLLLLGSLWFDLRAERRKRESLDKKSQA